MREVATALATGMLPDDADDCCLLCLLVPRPVSEAGLMGLEHAPGPECLQNAVIMALLTQAKRHALRQRE